MLQPGQIIGDMYRIERLLGSGGMADVFVVKHVRLPKHFALKVLRLESGERNSFLERFRREAEILATLKNAHLVEVFDHNEMADGNPYLIMELLEGEDLSQFLMRSGGPLSVATALSICNQVGEALDAAHQVGIVHRDLKPSNIFLCKREAFPNYVKVLDFGIAKQTQAGRTPLTAERALMGTPGYMAPEQALGKTALIDHRTDQFALAAILYEMLAGKPAFYQPEDTTYSILTRVVNDHPPPLPPPHTIIQRALQRALSKNPEERFPSIKAFLAATGANNLTIHVPSVPEGLHSTASNGEVTMPYQRRGRLFPRRTSAALLAIGIGGSLATVLIAAATQWGNPRTTVQNQPAAQSAPADTTPSPGPAPVESGPKESPSGDTAQPKPTPTEGKESPPEAAPVPEGSPEEPAGTKTPEDGSKPVGTGSSKENSDASPTVKPAPTGTTPTASSSPGTAAAKPPVVPRPHPTPQVPRSYAMSGVNGIQEKLLQECARKELNGINGIANQVIKLERSGALQITEAPPAVYETNFGYCIRKIFSRSDMIIPVPPVVTIRVRGTR